MTEFWERFAFYGMRWALTLYIVAQFFNGSSTGEAYAGRTYGAYLALVYAAGMFGGFIADRLIGHQRSILTGAVVMGAGLFVMMIPNQQVFVLGLSLVIIGNGLFKPNISTMVGELYAQGDYRRDAGFTIFYMGINAGALISPVITERLAGILTDTTMVQNYKVVFAASGIGMILSYIWFWFGRRQLQGIGAPPQAAGGKRAVGLVALYLVVGVPLVYFLIAQLGATALAWILGLLFIGLAVMLLIEGAREGKVARDKVIAMLIIFVFNVLFWMFFEQAGSSFNFLAEKLVHRDFGAWEFPIAWFQSVNSIAIIVLAPIIAAIWVAMGKRNVEPSIPRKFGLGLIFNGTRVPAADVRADLSRRPQADDSVLDAVHGLRDPVGRRTVSVADRPVDGHEACTVALRGLRDGWLVPVGRERQQSVRAVRERGFGRDRHDDRVGAERLYVRLLVADGRRGTVIPHRPADQQAHARREVTMGHGGSI